MASIYNARIDHRMSVSTESALDTTRPVAVRRRGTQPAPGPAPTTAAAAATATAPRVAVGALLRKRYRLQAVLGRGGMGTVFEASDSYRADIEGLDPRLAVKVLHTEVTQRPDLLAELQREFRNTQSLSHPNIVRAFEFDRDGDVAFFTMELLSGALLSTVLHAREQHPLSRSDALTLIRDIGAALEHAHSRDVVHGDLTPRNIFVTHGGDVRVLDFGASRRLAAEPTIAEPPPHPPFATPEFASCELLAGETPDARDDIYAFACVAYMLLTGRHPFQGQTAAAARARRLRPRAPRGLPAAQWRVLRAGLEWNRERRPADMRNWLAQWDFRAAKPRLPALATLMVRTPRRRSLTPVVGTAAALIAAVGLGSWWATNRPRASDGVAPLEAGTPPLSTTSAAPPAYASAVPPAVPPATSAATSPAAATAASSPAPPDASPPASTIPSPLQSPVAASLPPTVGAAAMGRHIAFSSDVFETLPGESVAHVTIRRSGNLDEPVSFEWWTEPDSARPDTDYVTTLPTRERIPAGKDSIRLPIPLVSDPLRHVAKSFYVAIESASAGVTLGAPARAEVVMMPPRD